MNELRYVRRRAPNDVELPLELHPVLRRVYAARGIRNASDLDLSLAGLYRTESLGGIDSAVDLLETAIRQEQQITIVADFDADGATSCAAAIRALNSMGANNVSYLVPNRFEYGYGLTPPIVALASRNKPALLITVDNGISSIEGVDAASAAGMKVLVTDHHLPGAELPRAEAIVNPNLEGDQFPSKCLAGVGVIFYVMLALRQRLRATAWFESGEISYPNLANLLDLVALGTVADVVPLDQNNRRLVAQGLGRIRQGNAQAGIAALLKVAGRDPSRLTSGDLGFAIGPRLNAAGRLADMSLGIECLLCDDARECERMAGALDDLNRERRAIEGEMKLQAMELVEAMSFDSANALPVGLCLVDETWHQGVVGIVASRIKDKFHRPVIAFAPTDSGELKGSGRSIPGVHLRDALDAIAAQNPGLLTKFGGHAMAAGLSLSLDSYAAFASAFAREVARQLGEEGIRAEITTDGELDDSDFSLDLAELLARSGPWGQRFPEPLFDGEFDIVSSRVVGETHLRLELRPTLSTKVLNAIAFGAVEEPWASGERPIRAAYRLAVNDYRGERTLQLIVEQATAINRL